MVEVFIEGALVVLMDGALVLPSSDFKWRRTLASLGAVGALVLPEKKLPTTGALEDLYEGALVDSIVGALVLPSSDFK